MGSWTLLQTIAGAGISYGACVHNGKIYFSTEDGQLWESTAVGAFVSVAPPITIAPFVTPCYATHLISFSGNLYAWCGRFTILLKWNGANAWTNFGKGDNNGSYGGIAALGTDLFMVAHARYYKWNGGGALITVTDTGVTDFLNMIAASDGKLYSTTGNDLWQGIASAIALVATNTGSSPGTVEHASVIMNVLRNATLYKWTGGGAMVAVLGNYASGAQCYSPLSWNGRLYAGLYNSASDGGSLLSWNTGEGAWTLETAQVPTLVSVYKLFDYSGRLFASLGPIDATPGSSASLYEFTPTPTGNPSGAFLPTFIPGL